MTYGRSLQRQLGLPAVFTEWAHQVQEQACDRAPLRHWQALRAARGGTRASPKNKRRAVARRVAEVAERRAVFDATNNN
jgi:hypothetical protein